MNKFYLSLYICHFSLMKILVPNNYWFAYSINWRLMKFRFGGYWQMKVQNFLVSTWWPFFFFGFLPHSNIRSPFCLSGFSSYTWMITYGSFAICDLARFPVVRVVRICFHLVLIKVLSLGFLFCWRSCYDVSEGGNLGI